MDIGTEIHRELAVAFNGEVWGLLEKPDRSDEESLRMIHAAHASLYHWLHAGTAVHEQRGEWLISRAYATLGLGDAALRHAQRCVELTEKHRLDMRDFDVAYSYEALARAHGVLGNRAEAVALKARARRLGDQIAGPEDRQIFDGDLAAGDWHGVE